MENDQFCGPYAIFTFSGVLFPKSAANCSAVTDLRKD